MNKKFLSILTKEFLLQKLVIERRTRIGLARDIGCCKQTIIYACKKHNIYEEIKKIKPIHPNFVDLKNKVFGRLTVKELSQDKKWGKPVWICDCSCGRQTRVAAASLSRGFTVTCTKCISINYRGYKDISKKYWSKIKNRANEKGLEFNITPKFIWNLFLKQDKKCLLSGVDIYFNSNYLKQTASIDRIDSSKGYTVDNVQLIHKRLQRLKIDMLNEELYSWIREIYKLHQNDGKISREDLSKIKYCTNKQT